MSVSYEERLSSLVLKEEFFPLVDEMKDFIGTLTAAGKGIVCCPDQVLNRYGPIQILSNCIIVLRLIIQLLCLCSELLESDHLHSVIRLVLKTGNYMNAVSEQHVTVESWMTSLL